MSDTAIGSMHRLTLTDAELGLLILLLIECNLENNTKGIMVFENIVTGETATALDLIKKLMKFRFPHRVSWRVQ